MTYQNHVGSVGSARAAGHKGSARRPLRGVSGRRTGAGEGSVDGALSRSVRRRIWRGDVVIGVGSAVVAPHGLFLRWRGQCSWCPPCDGQITNRRARVQHCDAQRDIGSPPASSTGDTVRRYSRPSRGGLVLGPGRRAGGHTTGGRSITRALVMTGRHPRHDLDELLVHPVRLSIVAALTGVERAEFALVRDSVEVTASMLSKQITLLEAADYVEVIKGRAGALQPNVADAHRDRARRVPPPRGGAPDDRQRGHQHEGRAPASRAALTATAPLAPAPKRRIRE